MIILRRILTRSVVSKDSLRCDYDRRIFMIIRLASSAAPKSSWARNAIRLIKAKKGSWTSQDWGSARDGLRHWKWEQLKSIESSDMAWSLLDRLFLEATKRQINVDPLDVNPVDILNGFVFAWSEGPEYKLTVNEVWRKLESYRAMGSCPMLATYNILLDTAIKSGLPDAHSFAEEVLWTLQQDTANNNSTIKPDSITFGIAINAWAKSGAPDALERAEVLFQTMKDSAAQGHDDALPNQIIINTMIAVCAKSSRPEAAVRAEELLRESPNPDELTFSSVLNALANSDAPDAPDRCYDALRYMQTSYKVQGFLAAKPNTVSYGTIIAAYARKGRVKEAENVLQEQINEYEGTKEKNLFPNQIHFNALIDAYAKSREQGAARKAEALLTKIQSLAEQRMDDNLLPDVISFTSVLHAYARSNEPTAATSAEAILKRMIDLHRMGISNVKPSLHSYSAVLACWAQTRSKQGATRAEAILRRMIERSNSGEEDIRPNTICFATVIDAIVKSRARDAPERAEALLTEMEYLSKDLSYDIELNQHCFSAVITAWSQSGRKEAVSRAEALIERMKHMALSGQPDLQPTMFTYCTLLAVYASAGKATKATMLLNRLCTDFVTGRSRMKTVSVAFSTVLSAWAKSREPRIGWKADKVYARMIELGVQPDASTFSALVSAWGNSRDRRAPQKAEFYLNELKNHYRAGRESCKPSSIVYTTVINAWGHSSHPAAMDRVAGLLQEMMEEDASGNHACRPNVITYNSIISCIAKSNHADKAVKAFKVLAEMEEKKIQPDISSFNAVLMACAFSSKYAPSARKKAYAIACDICQRASSETNRPNRDTFSFFFQAACGMGETKELEVVYQLCCQEGLQNDELVLRDLRQAAPHLINSVE